MTPERERAIHDLLTESMTEAGILDSEATDMDGLFVFRNAIVGLCAKVDEAETERCFNIIEAKARLYEAYAERERRNALSAPSHDLFIASAQLARQHAHDALTLRDAARALRKEG